MIRTAEKNLLDDCFVPVEFGAEGIAVVTLARSLGVVVRRKPSEPEWCEWAIPGHPAPDVVRFGGFLYSPYDCAKDAVRMLKEKGLL